MNIITVLSRNNIQHEQNGNTNCIHKSLTPLKYNTRHFLYCLYSKMRLLNKAGGKSVAFLSLLSSSFEHVRTVSVLSVTLHHYHEERKRSCKDKNKPTFTKTSMGTNKQQSARRHHTINLRSSLSDKTSP